MVRGLGFDDAFEFAKDPLAFLMNQRNKGDMAKVRFKPFQNYYVLYHPDAIHEVLVTKQDHFRKARGLQKLKVAAGEGLLTSEGEKHRSIVLISQYVVHPDPPYAYFPFGGGSRVCMGNHFAMMEAVLILAAIAQRYELRLTADHPPVVPEPLITMRPKDGLRMQILARSGKSKKRVAVDGG